MWGVWACRLCLVLCNRRAVFGVEKYLPCWVLLFGDVGIFISTLIFWTSLSLLRGQLILEQVAGSREV